MNLCSIVIFQHSFERIKYSRLIWNQFLLGWGCCFRTTPTDEVQSISILTIYVMFTQQITCYSVTFIYSILALQLSRFGDGKTDVVLNKSDTTNWDKIVSNLEFYNDLKKDHAATLRKRSRKCKWKKKWMVWRDGRRLRKWQPLCLLNQWRTVR